MDHQRRLLFPMSGRVRQQQLTVERTGGIRKKPEVVEHYHHRRVQLLEQHRKRAGKDRSVGKSPRTQRFLSFNRSTERNGDERGRLHRHRRPIEYLFRWG